MNLSLGNSLALGNRLSKRGQVLIESQRMILGQGNEGKILKKE